MNIDDPHDLGPLFHQFYDEFRPEVGPDFMVWFGEIEDIPQEWMDASIADLDTE